jgi:hypothetical protein
VAKWFVCLLTEPLWILQANCTGGCLYNPSGQWDCVNEQCLPDPCGLTEESGNIRLGTCAPGTGWSLTPDKTQVNYSVVIFRVRSISVRPRILVFSTGGCRVSLARTLRL